MIRKLKIVGYKSFDKLELSLNPLMVILGPNSSGKSNFLDALYILSRAVSEKNLKEAFDGHRGLPLESFYYGDKGYGSNLEKNSLNCTFEVDVELSKNTIDKIEKLVREKRSGIEPSATSRKKIITEKFLRYILKIEILPKSGYLRVVDECLRALRQNGEEKSRKPFLERTEDRISLRMEGQAHPTYYDIGLDHTVVSTPLYEPHYPHIAAFKEELANWHTYYLEPKTLMRKEVPLANILGIGSMGENLAAFLNTLETNYDRDFLLFNKALNLIMPTNAIIQIEKADKEGLVGFQLSENGIAFSSRLISEGTLRIIGLLAAIHPLNPSTMVAFEEPENGVHPVRLRIISDILRNAVEEYGKQIIITTHSPILPNYFEIEDLYICKREDNESTITPFPALSTGLFKQSEIDRALEDRILRGDFGG